MAPISQPSKPGKPEKKFPQNQRATVRYRCPPAAVGRLYLAEDLEFQRAWLQNLSATGIGLLLSKPLEYGLFVTIQVKGSSSDTTYNLSAHAIHAHQQTSGDWLVGCQLVDALSSEVLDDLL